MITGMGAVDEEVMGEGVTSTLLFRLTMCSKMANASLNAPVSRFFGDNNGSLFKDPLHLLRSTNSLSDPLVVLPWNASPPCSREVRKPWHPGWCPSKGVVKPSALR